MLMISKFQNATKMAEILNETIATNDSMAVQEIHHHRDTKMYLWHRQEVKAQMNVHICVDSPGPSTLAYTK